MSRDRRIGSLAEVPRGIVTGMLLNANALDDLFGFREENSDKPNKIIKPEGFYLFVSIKINKRETWLSFPIF